MIPLVTFRTSQGSYALAVEHTGGVLDREELQPLPAPVDGVLGLQRVGDESLPILAVLGADGRQVVVVDAGGRRFGLLVREVLGVVRVTRVSPPPPGQRVVVVEGVVDDADGALLIDPHALADHLDPA